MASEGNADIAVYRFYDSRDRLLYVGMTGNPKVRFREHRRSAQWWCQCEPDRTTMVWYDTAEKAAAAEITAIATEKPLYNVGRGGEGVAAALTSEQIDALETFNVIKRQAEHRIEGSRKRVWAAVQAARLGGISDRYICRTMGFRRSDLLDRLGPHPLDLP